ncbi:hypothetical protein [Cronobacter sp. JZ38]|uniref:hypothetical protein n=1 Tax=Cronobacter sp. JZ38 TaxID=1906275 RepID=UPI0015564463|nr:hypothetical protein [Cronobacter sp. JZ38]
MINKIFMTAAVFALLSGCAANGDKETKVNCQGNVSLKHSAPGHFMKVKMVKEYHGFYFVSGNSTIGASGWIPKSDFRNVTCSK